uniref:DUF1524 domain-containing protein n=1 Tax=Meloidogyne hapla TaxID=6305 RepID=A0A1I8B976_MELHA
TDKEKGNLWELPNWNEINKLNNYSWNAFRASKLNYNPFNYKKGFKQKRIAEFIIGSEDCLNEEINEKV